MVDFGMIIVFIFFGITCLLLIACSIAPFLIKYNNSIPTEEEEQAIKLLPSCSLSVKNACKHQCPHCGNKLLPSEDGKAVRCYKCNHLWHPDYILTVYEDRDV